MNTVEGNKIIAEFMGIKNIANCKEVGSEYQLVSMQDGGIWTWDELAYHTSWDWLMPACKKWDTLDGSLIKNWHEYQNRCDVLDNVVTVYDILPVWRELVENIEWYNKNQTK